MCFRKYGFPIYGDYFGVAAFKDGLSKDQDTEYDLLCYPNGTCNDYMWKKETDADFEGFAEFGTVGLDCTGMVNPSPAEFLKQNNPSSIFLELFIIILGISKR